MKTFKSIHLMLLLLITVCLPTQAQTWLIQSVQILDIETGLYSQPKDVKVEDGKIIQIGKSLPAAGAEIIAGNSGFLVPGFTEMHAHVPPSRISDEQRDELMFLYSSHGITSIRGMLGHPLHLTLRDQLNRNEVNGPRLITSGPSFNGSSIAGPKMAANRTVAQQEKGYDFIKVHPGMSAESYRAMAAKAVELDFPFAGHVNAHIGIVESAKLGQATVDHLDGVMQALAITSGATQISEVGFFGSALVDQVDEKHIPALAKTLARTGIAMVPTESLMLGFTAPDSAESAAKANAVALMPKATVERWKQTRQSIHNSDGYSAEKVTRFMALRGAFIKAFVDAGGVVLLGSDAPQVFNVPGDSIHVEMQLMADAGMTPLQILTAASLAPAQFFGIDNQVGSISVGLDADLVLLNSDPLKDIANTRDIHGVMTRGSWLSADQIAKGLAAIKRRHK